MHADELNRQRRLEMLVAFAVACVCLGYGWHAWRWGTPIFAVLWDQSLLGAPVALLTGMDWNAWASSPRVEAVGNGIGAVCGLLLSAAAAAALAWPWREALHPLLRRGAAILLVMSASILMFWSLLKWVDSGFEWPQLPEHASQYLVPLLLLWIGRIRDDWWRRLAMLALAGTFLGHACYALGWPRTPGHYLTMLMNGLGVGQGAATMMLHTAGLLDVLAVLGLCWRRTRIVALWWMIVWGFATAGARLVGTIDPAFLASGLEQWLHQVILRLVHGVLPLVVLLLEATRSQGATTPTGDRPTDTTDSLSTPLLTRTPTCVPTHSSSASVC